MDLKRKQSCFLIYGKTTRILLDSRSLEVLEALSYAAEHITSGEEELELLVGVDTQVCHGVLRCGAIGLITGVGNVLPQPVLKLFALCQMALSGDCQAKNYAYELEDALKTLSTFDEGPDLVLYYKYLLFLKGRC
jgi:4-hydroxy-tetrahydrodipicolinate synthase